MKKTDAGGTTFYPGEHYEVKGGVVTKYYYLGGQRVAMKVGSTVYWLHGDHLGSASLTTNSSGGIYAQQRYYPYGEVRWSSGSLPTDLQFTGQRNETSLGIYDYKARFYSPRLGRFLSADTIIPDLKNSQDLNRYVYVRNNPVKHTDPTGHCIFGLDTVVCLAVGGAIVGALVGYGTQVYQNVQQGMEFKDALTTNIDPRPVIGGAFLGGAVGAFLPAVGSLGGLVAGGTAVATAEVMDGDADEIRIAEQIVEREWTTLGRYPGYVDTANRLQTNMFSVPAEQWNQLTTRAEQWAMNQQYLDQAIKRGDVFLLDTPFVKGIMAEGSFFQQELLYLLEKGYQIVTIQGQDWLLPPN